MLNLPEQKGKAIWKNQLKSIEHIRKLDISPANIPLYNFLLEVTGKYIFDVSSGKDPNVDFYFDCREDSPGFLKLDVLYEMIIVGCNYNADLLPRIFRAVENTLYIASQKQDGVVSFVPIITFGKQGKWLFYIESPRGFANPTAFFIKTAHTFVLDAIIPALNGFDNKQVFDYVTNMKTNGIDIKNALGFEPLINSIINPLPGEIKAEMIKQIGAEFLTDLTSSLK